jgi:hypothetical protein
MGVHGGEPRQLVGKCPDARNTRDSGRKDQLRGRAEELKGKVRGDIRFSTLLYSNVVGAMVMSSSTSAADTTGAAGRAICSSAGGISICGGSSTAVSSFDRPAKSAAVIAGQNMNSAIWMIT